MHTCSRESVLAARTNSEEPEADAVLRMSLAFSFSDSDNFIEFNSRSQPLLTLDRGC